MRTLVLALLAVSCAEAAAPPVSFEEPLPQFALRRLGTTRFRTGIWEASCFSPDGGLLAVGHRDAIRVWHLATGTVARVVPPPAKRPGSPLHFTADGRRLVVDVSSSAATRRGSVQIQLVLVDIATGAAEQLVDIDDTRLRFTGLGRDGRTLFVGHAPTAFTTAKRLLALDLTTRKPIPGWERGAVHAMALSPDGATVAVGERDGTIRLRRPGEARPRELKGHTQEITHLAFSPDGARLASSIHSRLGLTDHPPDVILAATGSVRIWDVASGRTLAKLNGHGGSLSGLMFSPGGRYVAALDSLSAVVAWDAETGDVAARVPDAMAFTFSADGKQLKTALFSGELMFYDLAAGTRRRVGNAFRQILGPRPDRDGLFAVVEGASLHPLGHRAPVRLVAFAAGGEVVLTSDATNELHVWRAADGSPLRLFGGEATQTAPGFALAADGHTLVTVRESGEAEVRRLPSASVALRRTLPSPRPPPGWEGFAPPENVLVSADSLRGACIGRDHWAFSFDLRAGTFRRLRLNRAHEGLFGLSADGRLVAYPSRANRSMRLYHADSEEDLSSEYTPGGFDSRLAFRHDGKFVAWTDYDGVRVFDVRRGESYLVENKSRNAPPAPRRMGFVRPPPNSASLGFTPDGNLLVAWPAARLVGVYDPATRREVRFFGPLRGETAGSLVSPAGLVLVTTIEAEAGAERQYDLIHDRLLCRYPAKPNGVPAVRVISPDGRLLAVASDDIALIDLASGREFARFACGHVGGVTAMAFSRDGRHLATGGDDGTVLLWDCRAACGLTGHKPPRPDASRLEALWHRLGDDDTRSALRVAGELIAHPGPAAEFLRAKLRPAGPSEVAAVRRVIADLDADSFGARQRATQWLTAAPEWDILLRKALQEKPSLEVVKRIERILADADRCDYSAQTRRRLLAVWVLEDIGSPAAWAILKRAAAGVETSPLTRRAQRAISALPAAPS